jgi:DNA helicase-4
VGGSQGPAPHEGDHAPKKWPRAEIQHFTVGTIRPTMRLERVPFARFLLKLRGRSADPMMLTATGLDIEGRRGRPIPFSKIKAAPDLEHGRFTSALRLTLTDIAPLIVPGFRRRELEPFTEQLTASWKSALSAVFEPNRAGLQKLTPILDRLDAPRRYPSACLVAPYFDEISGAMDSVPWNFPSGVLATADATLLARLRDFLDDAERFRQNAINRFVVEELGAMSAFFAQIERNPLTPEQRLAVVTDEDATLVLASAGSGKTSVIVAKSAYLVERGIRRPEEILLLAFGKDAAAEMARRIKERTGADIDARTFHALAYSIIAEVEGTAPALAPHASDDKAFIAELREIVFALVARGGALAAMLVGWFAELFHPARSEWDFSTPHEYFSYVEAHELRSLKGDLVRSFEELGIANWLYVNGIDYEYEPIYEHPLPDSQRKAYTPDFRLKESGIYVEHFGVRKARGPGGETRLVTAPYIDREEYLAEMDWKRGVHKSHGTRLIETYSFERFEDGITRALHKKLEPFVTLKPLPPEQVFERLNEMGQVDEFTATLGTFLRHFKSAGMSFADCRQRASGEDGKVRALAFLELFEKVFEEYQARLDPRIDFEDVIARATKHVRAGAYASPFRHLLVDEFQDISRGRAGLLKALKAQHADARIFAVGDDWQSIYRFAGADIHLMRNFGAEFGGAFAGKPSVHATIDLGRTFRSVDRIALPARAFILRNPAQLEKQVIPAGKACGAAIRVWWHDKGEDTAALSAVLDELSQQAAVGSRLSVLLLGRYRHLRPNDLTGLESRFPNLSVRFMTIHGSKGLEADHVVLLGLRSGTSGMPSETIDDPLLGLVLPQPESFDHAEERRVFYVALTRARRSVTLLASRQKPSAFALELLDDPMFEVMSLGGQADFQHSCPTCGGHLREHRGGRSGLRFVCEHRAHCDTSLPSCSSCGMELPAAAVGERSIKRCACGAAYPACPKCSAGWLVERRGKYGNFLGCVRYPACDGKAQLAPERR